MKYYLGIIFFFLIDFLNAQPNYYLSPRDFADSTECFNSVEINILNEFRFRSQTLNRDSFVWLPQQIDHESDVSVYTLDSSGKVLKEEVKSYDMNNKIRYFGKIINFYDSGILQRKEQYYSDTLETKYFYYYDQNGDIKSYWLNSKNDTLILEKYYYESNRLKEYHQSFYDSTLKKFIHSYTVIPLYTNGELTSIFRTQYLTNQNYYLKEEFSKDSTGRYIQESTYLLDTISQVWDKVFYCNLYYKNKQISQFKPINLEITHYHLTNDDINFYHNPDWRDECLVEVYTIDGRLCKTKHFKHGFEGTMELDILPGIYFLKISSGGFVQTIKFIRT